MKEVPISSLEVSPLNVRKDIGDISKLVESIKKLGILEPLIVREKEGKYEIIVGRRRYEAAKQLGLEKVPVIIKQLSDADAVGLSLSENIQRNNLELSEEAEGYLKLINMGLSERQIAENYGISPQRISDTLEAHEIGERLRKALGKPSGSRTVKEAPSKEEREEGILPKEHAILLYRTIESEPFQRMSDEEREKRMVELAKVIAPLRKEEAKKVLDRQKMFPEESPWESKAKALTTVSVNLEIPADEAAKLQMLHGTSLKEAIKKEISIAAQLAERKEEAVEIKEARVIREAEWTPEKQYNEILGHVCDLAMIFRRGPDYEKFETEWLDHLDIQMENLKPLYEEAHRKIREERIRRA